MRNDSARLNELRRLLILDSTKEKAYDDITQLLATSLDVPITMINFLDAERDWFKSSVGLRQTQGPVGTSFCEGFFQSDDDLIVSNDTTVDPRYSSNPLVAGEPFIRFYAGARLTVSGHTVGTLCVYDIRPRSISPAQMKHIQMLAQDVLTLMASRG